MSMPTSRLRYTTDEYLALERASEERHIYLDGDIFAMAGESSEHGDISANVFGILYGQLIDSPCRVRTKDTKVRSGPTPMSSQSTSGFFSYPDVVVICDEPEYSDAHKDVLLNPSAILEVLSPTTEAFDRGEKFTRFQTWNETLNDYVLVSQDRPQVEHFRRQADGGWSYHLYTGLDAVVPIENIRCTLNLVDVYRRVSFPEQPAS